MAAKQLGFGARDFRLGGDGLGLYAEALPISFRGQLCHRAGDAGDIAVDRESLRGRVITGEANFDLLVELGFRRASPTSCRVDHSQRSRAPQFKLAPERKLLLDRQVCLIDARSAGAIDLIRHRSEGRIIEPPGRIGASGSGFGIECRRAQLRAEPPAESEDTLDRCSRRTRILCRCRAARNQRSDDRDREAAAV